MEKHHCIMAPRSDRALNHLLKLPYNKMYEEVKWSEVAQSCPTLYDPMDCSLSGSSLHGILQARILEWVAISFSRGSPRPRDRTWVSCIPCRCFNLSGHRYCCFYQIRSGPAVTDIAWGFADIFRSPCHLQLNYQVAVALVQSWSCVSLWPHGL